MGDASAQIRKVNYAWWQKNGSSQNVAPDLITAVDHQPAVGCCSLQRTVRKYRGSIPHPDFCHLWAVGMSINGTNEQPTEMTTGMPGSEESARCAWGRSSTHHRPPSPLSKALLSLIRDNELAEHAGSDNHR
ncbi:hypothetical protein ASPBRDRAFT_71955 [Aspergillus brasiliensis CBS 101740]|uniref:Uncharacterized protein n=1 Tax=Aspergillus brasiliensis (strain CBS 101740 / IMI 381727 / IBT 21946) TaxID=767769 RepID=A0A1L9UWB6_ASPBC|nr:hypothetical protein ASPBRDRAFT_71955 [Aspergillus brasiliensis CBS 101740]